MDARKKQYDRLNVISFLKLVLPILLILAFLFFCTKKPNLFYFPINTVRVYGINQTEQKEIKERILPLLKASFFSIKVNRIRDRLRAIEWVADLNVRRVWPDKIDIVLIEKKPVAIWNKQNLVDISGELFLSSIEKYADNLPNLQGPMGKQSEMLNYLVKMNRLLSPLQVKVSNLELTNFLSWKLTLDNGIQLHLGHKDILTRLDHFVKVYSKIVKDRASQVEYVDLRYPNGMAVQWRDVIKT